MTKTEILEALTIAKSLTPPAKTGAFGGCGRVYVSVSGERATINAVSAACKKLGLVFDRRSYYGTRNAIYIGYDNADGRALAKGEAFAAKLSELGLPAYCDAHGD